MEKVMEKTLDAFVKYHVEAERFQKREDERSKKGMELEEKRRKEDQQHEMRMMQMMQRRSHCMSSTRFNQKHTEVDSYVHHSRSILILLYMS